MSCNLSLIAYFEISEHSSNSGKIKLKTNMILNVQNIYLRHQSVRVIQDTLIEELYTSNVQNIYFEISHRSSYPGQINLKPTTNEPNVYFDLSEEMTLNSK